MPKVSVIMPVYNAEKYLEEAVKSVLNQTFDDFEFIIINDGSTDSSLDIIKSFKDERIRIIDNKCNLKIVDALNKGLDAAAGEYAVRMDADDICLADRLRKLTDFMDNNKNTGICGSYIQKFKGDKYYPAKKVPLSSDEINEMLFFRSPLMHPSVIMRMEFINKYNLRYRNEFETAEDYGFWVEAADFFDFANIPEVLLYYRLSENSITANNNRKMAQKRAVHNRIFSLIISKCCLNNDLLEIQDALYFGTENLKLLIRAVKYLKERKLSDCFKESIIEEAFVRSFNKLNIPKKILLMIFFPAVFVRALLNAVSLQFGKVS